MENLPLKQPDYYFVCPPGRESDWNGSGYYFETKDGMVGPYSIKEVNIILEDAKNLQDSFQDFVMESLTNGVV